MNNKERKIRELLGDRFHLCISYEDGIDNPKWSLFRNYDDSKVYFSNDNEVIMSSETNTIDELYEYAKKHHKIDEHLSISKLNVIVAWIGMIVMTINFIFFKNEALRGFVLGIDFMIIIHCVVSHNIWNKNWKVRMMELRENFLKIQKEREKND